MNRSASGSTPRPEAGKPIGGPAPEPRGLSLLMALAEKDLLFRLIGALLLYSLVPLAEIFLFVYLASLMGNFLILVVAVVVGAAGAVVAMDQARGAWRKLLTRLRADAAAGTEVAELAGIVLGAVLLITPGFLTDLCGLALFVPGVRRWAGQGVARLLASRGAGMVYSLKIR